MKESKLYSFEYLSEAHSKYPRTSIVTSTVELKVGDTIVISKENRGIFLGRIIDADIITNEDYSHYKFVQHIDVSAYFDAVEKEKRKEALRAEMEIKFKEIDKEKKFEYYATLDDEFRGLYEEYKSL